MNSVVSSEANPETKANPPPTCAILLPAFNEVRTIGEVVRVALESRLGEVFVVDDGSFDGTGEAAQQAGGRVISLTSNRGKGGAVAAAATTIDADVLVLIDADLTGLKATHLEALARPVLSSETDMTRGVFVGGRWQTAAAQRLTPQLNGQRGIWRELLLSVPGLEATRYGLEVAITEHARRSGWTVQDVPLMGVSQVMKEEKRGFWRGVGTRLGMYRDIVRTVLNRRW